MMATSLGLMLALGLGGVVACSANEEPVQVTTRTSLAPSHDEGGELDGEQGEPPPPRSYMAPDDSGTSNDGAWPGLEDIQLLSVSDWHGQLDPNAGVGGAAVLSTYFKQARAENPRTLTFTAGDAVGASPPLSSVFDDIPAIHAMNLMGFDADTFGNHNFDRGLKVLQSQIDLARFEYVSSNLRRLSENLSGVSAPYAIFRAGRTKVGVVGITNPEAPSLVFPGNMGTLEVAEAVSAANDAIHRAQAAGASVIVVLAHMGATGVDAHGHPVGPLLDFASGVRKADVIFGDHTDFALRTRVNGALVIENRSKGATYAKVKLRVAGSAVLSSSAEILPAVASAVTPDPVITDMLAGYRTELAAKFDRPVGIASSLFERGSNIERLREVPIGNLVADAMRIRSGARIAFTNGGGIRASLPSSYQRNPSAKSLP